MAKLNCFRDQFDFTPGRFVYQQPPTEGPKEQGEKREAPKKTPDKARREEQKEKVRKRYGDDNLEKISFTPAQAKETLSTKAKLSAYIAKRKAELQKEDIREDKMSGSKEKQIDMRIHNEVYQMLMALKSDPKSLQDVIATHLDSDEAGVARTAIELSENWEYILKANDDYFKGLFNNPKSTLLVRDRALERIQDESFKLKAVLDAIQKGENFNYVRGVWVHNLKERASYEKVLAAIKAKPQAEQDRLYGNTKLWLEDKLKSVIIEIPF
jgi:hypothetical protein